MFPGSCNPMALVEILSDQTGSGKFKMATSKPEILIVELSDKIIKKF